MPGLAASGADTAEVASVHAAVVVEMPEVAATLGVSGELYAEEPEHVVVAAGVVGQ